MVVATHSRRTFEGRLVLDRQPRGQCRCGDEVERVLVDMGDGSREWIAVELTRLGWLRRHHCRGTEL